MSLDVIIIKKKEFYEINEEYQQSNIIFSLVYLLANIIRSTKALEVHLSY